MENTELIKVLRCELYGDDECDKSDCPIWSELGCRNGIGNRAAADALEAAEKRIDGLQKLVDINTERCEALRKQLRESHESYEKHINELTTKCNQLQAEVDNYEKRIAELMPKEGEWRWLSSTYDRVPCEMRYWCSVCHHEEITHNDKPWKRYCPNCGARMKGENDERTD